MSNDTMSAEEIVRGLTEYAEWCDANEYEVPICMGDDLIVAASLIKSLAAQLTASQQRERAAGEDLYMACKHSPCNTGICVKKNCTGNHIPCEFEWRGPGAGEGAGE